LLIRDAEVNEKLVEEALVLVKDKDRLGILSKNIKKMATPSATNDIVEVIASLLN
jgi:UDP-N-acetylglucosamine:LPS N-acetylglucosamine transferase